MRFFEPRGEVRAALASREPEVLVEGPAGTGKTRGLLQEGFAIACAYPGARVLLTRQTRSSMTNTVLVTFERDVLGPDCPLVHGARRDHRTSYDLPNGSAIACIGLENTDRIMSGEYDLILGFEATEFLEEDFQKLTTRLRNHRTPHQQIKLDCNPTSPAHWLNQRALEGRMRRFVTRHQDNPFLFNADGSKTAAGESYMARLEALTGSTRDRLLFGKWVSEEMAFFDADVLLAHRRMFGQEPVAVGDITLDADLNERDQVLRRREASRVRFVENPLGKWKFWRDPDELFRSTGQFAGGADVSMGVKASNSVIAIGDVLTRSKVAEYAAGDLGPEEFARLFMMALLYFRGMEEHAFGIWEDNGPGRKLGDVLVNTLEASNLYRRETLAGGTRTTRDEYGWVSTKDTKSDAALDLREAYQHQTYTNPSKSSIDEALNWINFPDTTIGPAKLANENQSARKAHGDRVIGDMLLNLAMRGAKLRKPAKKPTEPYSTDWWRQLGRAEEERLGIQS